MVDLTCVRTTPAELQPLDRPRREPVTDPTLGIDVARGDGRQARDARHRLVAIGDSLTQGFMSAAVFRTDLSWPVLVAQELGLAPGEFRFPLYEWPTGPGGLPLDLERLARAFAQRFGPRLDFWEIASAGVWLQRYLDRIEDYWERGEGARTPPSGEPLHSMAVYGWDVLDATLLTAEIVAARIGTPRDDLLAQIVEDANARAAWVVLQRARTSHRARTVLETAIAMGRAPQGIETLVVALGANNALGSVLRLAPCWTPPDYLELSPRQRLAVKSAFSVWRPAHFAAEWAQLVQRLRRVRAQHVIVATVPAVTIAPIARGVGEKIIPSSAYFPYYTRPWIDDNDFDPDRDPHLTGAEAAAVDLAIDAYNATIVDSVAAARADGLDWCVFDMAALLDRLAMRRYVASPLSRPAWWTPYELPPPLQALDPVPNTRFFRSGPTGRTDGGLFSLDGVHPTTIGYGILAQEIIRVMELAGVTFCSPDGQPRDEPVSIDFEALLLADTLVSDPPVAVSPTLSLLGWLDQRLDWVGRLAPSRSPR